MNDRTIIMIAMVAVVMMIGHASAAVTVLSEPAADFTNGTYKASAVISVVTFGISQSAGETLDNVTVTVADESVPGTVTGDFASLKVYKENGTAEFQGTELLVGTETTVNVDSATTINTTGTAIGTTETTFYVVVTLAAAPGNDHQFSVDMATEGVATNDSSPTVTALDGGAAAIATIDTAAPTVTSATLNYNDTDRTLVVLFSEMIDASATVATKFHLNNVAGDDNVNLSAAPTDTDATTLTFTLTEAQRVAALAISGVPGGDGGDVVLDVDAAGVTDMAGNTNTVDDNNTVTETADTTAPTMSSAARVNNTHITVTMSESVTNLGAADGGFIVAKNGDPGTTYAVSAIAAGGSANLVVLTVADISGSIAAGVKVTYNATENGTITDMAGNDLANATGVIVAAWKTSSGDSSSSGGSGTYPPGWSGTPTVTATTAPTPSATGTATVAPPGDKVTPEPTKKPDAVATTPAAEGTTAETAKNGVPGFTSVFVIAGMLAVAYAMMRRRE